MRIIKPGGLFVLSINTKVFVKDGFKEKLFIGVENEKFLIDNSSGKRINYKQTLDVLNFLKTLVEVRI